MLVYKTVEETALIRESCMMVSKTLAEVAKVIKPGISGLDLDKVAEEFILDNGGVPSFKGYRGFPNSLCISVNEQVVHGIPSKQPYKEGDIVSVDCGVLMNDFHGDSAYTFAVGDVSEEVMKLLRVTKESLYIGIDQAISGNRIGDISFAIQQYCEKEHNYSIVRELVGHGIGKSLHEDPEVPNYGRRGQGIKMNENLTIAIEPMVNLGKRAIVTLDDGWTIATQDNMPSAHFEHTVSIQKNKADVLTSFQIIEEASKNNIEIKEIA